MLKAIISTEDGECVTEVHGETIEIVLEKITRLHTMTECERKYFLEKNIMDFKIDSGWYIKNV